MEDFGGCYLKKMGLHPTTISFSSSIRVLLLKLTSKSSSKDLHFIVPDILKATLFASVGQDPGGNDFIIFRNTVGFTVEYRASFPPLYVLSHKTICPCECCVCTRRMFELGSEYSYLSIINRRRPAYVCTKQRK